VNILFVFVIEPVLRLFCERRENMDAVFWPNFHRLQMYVSVVVVVVLSVCHRSVATQSVTVDT